MLKSLILIALMMNLSFAKDRFTEADKKRFLQDVKQGIAEHKVENKGRVDLQIIKPGFYAELEESLKQEKFTREEMIVIKQRYELFSKSQISPERAEEAFYTFVQKELDEINKRPLEKVKEGEICNNWSCAEGLKCAPHPVQNGVGKLKKAGVICSENNECTSGECVEETAGSKKKVCEEVYLCFRPLTLGQSCLNNPVCGQGACLPYSSNTSGIGECNPVQALCRSNSDCCSNSCGNGICRENNICKDCVGNGNKPQRGQKCCEGLYMNDKGMCIPDVPPSVIPQVHYSPVKTFIAVVASFFISTADAGEIAKIQADFDAMLNKADGAPGSKIPFGTGTFTVGLGDTLVYTDSKGAGTAGLTEKTNLIKLAQKYPSLRKEIITKYGVDPLAVNKTTNEATKAYLDKLIADNTKISEMSLGTASSKVLNIPGLGTISIDPGLTETENIPGIPSSVTGVTGIKYSPISEFLESNEYAALSGTKLQADDYEFLADEKISATKTEKSSDEARTDAEELEDEQEFLNKGVKNDGQTLAGGIMADKDKYSYFVPTSTESKKSLNMTEKNAKIGFNKKSNFQTCDIEFKDDFYNSMKTDGSFDLEVAMLGFDFVITGDAESDFWRGQEVASFNVGAADGCEKTEKVSTNKSDNSLYNRLRAVGLSHRQKRKCFNQKLAEADRKLTCMCLDVQGYNKITDATKKKFFETSCTEELVKYNDPNTSFDELEGDASGLKAKRLLTDWSRKLKMFYAELTTDNTESMKELGKISNWVNSDAKWSTAKTKNYDLFKFNIKNPSGNIAGLGAIVGALLAAGVIAIMGGFATTSILSAWGAAGIITASAVTGAGGLWMIATLKGAWITQSPQISDGVVAPRSYSCGKKETCMEYTRTLVQPYNEVCNIHTSSNACIKSFVVINDGSEPAYIVDPWIPVGVSRAAILSNQPNYAEKLEQGFAKARNAMVNKNPGASGGGGKKGGGEFVSEAYLSEVFIDQNILGNYVPAIGSDLEKTYFLNVEKVRLIKEAAKKFAVSEGFLEEGDKENLKEFADYAYTYHFLWPKRSRPEEVSYPTLGLSTYLDYIAVKVSGNLSTSQAGVAAAFSKLNEQYLKDYKNNLLLFAEKPINQTDAVKKSLINAELEKVNKELDTLLTMNSMLDNRALDTDLSKLNNSFIANQAKNAGASGTVAFTSGDANFLRAIGDLRSTRKTQLAKLATYNKAMAANGDKNRATKMASLSKNFGDSFSKGKNGGSGGSWGAGAGSSSGSGNSSTDGSTANDKNAAGKTGYGSLGSGAGSYGADSGSGGLYGSGSGSSSSNKSTSGTDTGAGGRSGYANNDDQNKLSDAIDARNANNGKYQSTDGQTLFEKITNAYIRNYDKVLSKKKDKDVIEDKQ